MSKPTWKEEKSLRAKGHLHIAGSDEVGKGAWAGPLVAAAVILPVDFSVTGINDSKQLTPKQRQQQFVRLTKNALSWAVAIVPNDLIDRIGIQKANIRAIEKALTKLHISPDAVLVDAVKVRHGKKPVKAIIKGDAKVFSIAAASIIAKVVRDVLMEGLDRQVPGYAFSQHKGYGTPAHQAALKALGPSVIHRKSFEPMKSMVRGRARRKS